MWFALVFLKAICFLQRRTEAEAAIARGDVVLNDASLEDPIAITRQGNLQLYSDVSGSLLRMGNHDSSVGCPFLQLLLFPMLDLFPCIRIFTYCL